MSKPNLIYIFADQLRAQSLGYNGDELAKTPCIDSFSLDSTDMCNAFSGHPVCAPYRASLLTGKFTTSTGMVINEIRISGNHTTFADVLNNGGYETGYIGKWHLYAAKLGDHFNPENSFVPPGRDRLGFNGLFAAYNFHHEYYSPRAYYHLDTPEKLYYGKYEPDAQTDMALAELERMRNSEKPFALFLSLGTPHDPWNPENVPSEYYDEYRDTVFPTPPNYSKRNDSHADMWARFKPLERTKLNDWQRTYYAMVKNLDYNIGRLINGIKELGLYDNSIIVFTSDHGEMFGAQGRRAKNIFYNEAVHVPFLIKHSNNLAPGKNETCINTVDIMPTLLSLMGLPVPQGVQGHDISSNIITGKAEENPALLMGTGPTAIWGNGTEWRGIRTRRYTYATYLSDSSEYLFDDTTDKYQTNNLANNPEYRELKNELASAMYSEMKRVGDKFRKNSYYKKNWVTNRVIKDELIP